MRVAQHIPLQFEDLHHRHLDEVLRIETEVYPEPWTRTMFLDEIRSDRSYFLVVFSGKVLVGYGGFWLVLDEAHVTSVVVRPEWQGRGLGRRLMEHLLAAAVDRDAHIATLEVRTSNIRARNLYLSMGFRPVGIRKAYYPRNNEDGVVMLKELD